MLVSWSWLSRYLDLPMSPDELASALSLSGLNHEGTEQVYGEVVIDLEVTSNRGDCLGHLGVAREIAVLYGLEMTTPEPHCPEADFVIEESVAICNEFAEACGRYSARLVRGCRVGPSPDWMADSLRAIGINPVNNIVDITNYVMMECGQPLHAFDLQKLAGPEIIVRPAKAGEELEAIDHKTYALDPSMCVIADAQRAVAVAGVMGGAATEVTEATTDVLLEAAIFTPMSVRKTARTLKLHSPSSYRFERRVDPKGVDWASRRACQLILELAGGELARGSLDTAPEVAPRPPVVLRLSQLPRVLGITVEPSEVARILGALGCELQTEPERLTVVPPSWRHDLTREADLIEEVARIHGYDKIPEDSPIPVAPSAKRPFDVAMERVRHVMSAAGISEAMTPSVVTKKLDEMLSPWTERRALETRTPMLKGSSRLRRSLLPSLLQSRADNWSAGSIEANLYEVAHIYLPGEKFGELPSEQYSLGLVAGGDFYAMKGTLEAILRGIGCRQTLVVTPEKIAGFDGALSVGLRLGDESIGFLGQIESKTQQKLKLPGITCAAEINLQPLFAAAELVPQYVPVSPFPAVTRDLNFVVAEAVRWDALEASTRAAVGLELTDVRYRETYRDAKKDGAGMKRVLLSVELQRSDATLTGGEADQMIEAIVARCGKDHGAKLLDA